MHAAISGRTEMVVGRWRRRFMHLPLALAVSKRNQVDPQRRPMESLLEATGQPAAAPAATLRSGSGTIRGSSGR